MTDKEKLRDAIEVYTQFTKDKLDAFDSKYDCDPGDVLLEAAQAHLATLDAVSKEDVEWQRDNNLLYRLKPYQTSRGQTLYENMDTIKIDGDNAEKITDALYALLRAYAGVS